MSGLVRRLLVEAGAEETDFERRKRLQDKALASIDRFSGRSRLTRDEVHARDVR